MLIQAKRDPPATLGPLVFLDLLVTAPAMTPLPWPRCLDKARPRVRILWAAISRSGCSQVIFPRRSRRKWFCRLTGNWKRPLPTFPSLTATKKLRLRRAEICCRLIRISQVVKWVVTNSDLSQMSNNTFYQIMYLQLICMPYCLNV